MSLHSTGYFRAKLYDQIVSMELWFKIPLPKMDEHFQGPKLCGGDKTTNDRKPKITNCTRRHECIYVVISCWVFLLTQKRTKLD